MSETLAEAQGALERLEQPRGCQKLTETRCLGSCTSSTSYNGRRMAYAPARGELKGRNWLAAWMSISFHHFWSSP